MPWQRRPTGPGDGPDEDARAVQRARSLCAEPAQPLSVRIGPSVMPDDAAAEAAADALTGQGYAVLLGRPAAGGPPRLLVEHAFVLDLPALQGHRRAVAAAVTAAGGRPGLGWRLTHEDDAEVVELFLQHERDPARLRPVDFGPYEVPGERAAVLAAEELTRRGYRVEVDGPGDDRGWSLWVRRGFRVDLPAVVAHRAAVAEVVAAVDGDTDAGWGVAVGDGLETGPR